MEQQPSQPQEQDPRHQPQGTPDAAQAQPVVQPDQKKDLPRLFDRKAVAIGSLVGTPAAGGLLLMVNAWRLGQRGGGRRWRWSWGSC